MKNNVIILLLVLSFYQLNGQPIAKLEVKFKSMPSFSIPVQVNLDAITFLQDSVLQLVEVKGARRIPIAYQVEYGQQRNLHWIITTGQANNQTRTYELIQGKHATETASMKAEDKEGAITISHLQANFLQYHYQTVYPPKGIDTSYKRSGFIHPLWSPRGQELTQVNAPDHYHHWGLWNPWTHVLFNKDTIDFWNLAKKEGTVRFASMLSTSSGAVFAGFQALHEHVVLKNGMSGKVALNELQSVKIYQPSGEKFYIADITIQLNCGGKDTVLLLEYRYGGLGLRATKEWNRNNSTIITSEGKDRKDADGSKARWVMVQGDVSGDVAGLVMMSYPTNYNFPEPLRVWPEDMNQRGDVFLNFSPTKNKNWEISPGKTYVLKYRLLVFNDSFSKQNAESAWRNFAEPPQIIIKKMMKR